MTTNIALVWFRQDLRRSDNPALHHAYEQGYQIVPVYILDEVNCGEWKTGGAAKVWLHHALNDLTDSLSGHLVIRTGDAKKIIPDLVKAYDAQAVFWNRCYEKWRVERDKQIKEALQQSDIEVKSFNGSLIWEPWTIKTQSGGNYKVFTPFYRKGCLPAGEPDSPLPAPERLTYASDKHDGNADDLNLLPARDWGDQIIQDWTISEEAAQKLLLDFVDNKMADYKDKRNLPDVEGTSRLSPYLHWGQISPRQIWSAARHADPGHMKQGTYTFLSEIGWREFSYHLLYHFPDFPDKNFNEKFDAYEWKRADPRTLKKWQHGQTGYPIVDAGMRQLWQTGWMHNRVRMIVASFLCKDMHIDWRHGEKWFWDTLLEADLAANSTQWQWVAGSGADAQPFFRIFNSVTQGEKFDPEGNYVRTYCPELKDLPNKFIHKPWEAPEDILKKAGISLGKEYPEPIVDHKEARAQALAAYNRIK